MRRILLVIALSFSMLIPVSNNANAIFGLSKCEKISKEIKSSEKKIDLYITKWSPYYGKLVPSNEMKAFADINKAENDPVLKILKVGFNNPKCFTRTQNLAIEEARKAGISLKSYVNYYFSYITKQTPECKKLIGITPNCLLGEKYEIGFITDYSSIYNS